MTIDAMLVAGVVGVMSIIMATVVGGFLLLMRKSGSTSNSSELTYLRQEVARLNKEVEQLREDAEQSKNGPKATGSTDIRSKWSRGKGQAEYVEDFLGAVVAFLAFHENYADLAEQMARTVTDHATPVGSGTVARTKRIPVEQRAEAAVIAWLRHQTTGYENPHRTLILA